MEPTSSARLEPLDELEPHQAAMPGTNAVGQVAAVRWAAGRADRMAPGTNRRHGRSTQTARLSRSRRWRKTSPRRRTPRPIAEIRRIAGRPFSGIRSARSVSSVASIARYG